MGKKNTSNNIGACEYPIHHIGALDGIRAVAILVVVWFHFWQQCWLTPHIGDYSLDWIGRHGSIAVDMMILLSGFCLFLPHAREMVYGAKEKADNPAKFYVKRVARIAPSYYLSVFIVLFCFAIPLSEYSNNSFLFKDLIPHLTFTHNLFESSTCITHLNGVLWTVAVEVQFYIFFPWIAKIFKKKPIITYIVMCLAGLIACNYISNNFFDLEGAIYTNHVTTFICVFANGMLGAWLYVAMTKDRKKNVPEGIFFTVLSLTGIWIYKLMCEARGVSQDQSLWQVDNRFILSLVFLLIVISTIMSVSYYQKIWDNKVMKFIAGISFNLYICHQYVAVKLKEFHIPFWEGDEPPNVTGDTQWQFEYLFLCIVVSLVIAIAMTYLVEKPAAKLIMKIYNKYKKS